MVKATKPATKTATKKRKKGKVSGRQGASQLEVLAEARDHFGKKYPDQIIVMDELDNTVPGYISTQSLALDWIIGNGGAPQSRIVDFSGDEGVGKSTGGDHLMAEVQRLGGHAWLWDTENARDGRYQEKVGVVRASAGQLLCDTLEDGFEVMIDLVGWYLVKDPNRPGIILWDTPAGTPTRCEIDIKKTNERFGPAKLIRTYIRNLNRVLKKSRWILCVVNQTYQGQNQGGQTYKAVYGGGGIPFYSSVRLALSHPSKQWRSASDKDMHLPPMGQTVWVNCSKNRVGVPWRSKQIFIEYGVGINNIWELFNVLLGAGCISLNGSWYGFDPDFDKELAAAYPKKWQGGFLVLEAMIKDNPNLWQVLLKIYLDLTK
jgi:recombination protein RecA